MTLQHPRTSVEQTRWLDTALAGQPAAVKARVLGLLLRYGVDPDNEFFMIFAALGQLQVLVEDSPHAWQHLFSSFEGELNAWTETHLETLEALSDKAETTEKLAGISKELGTILLRLTQSCNELMQRLERSDQLLMTSTGNWNRSLKTLNEAVTALTSTIHEQNTQTQDTLHILTAKTQKPNTPLRSARLLTFTLLLSLIGLGHQTYQLHQTGKETYKALEATTEQLAQTKQQTQWLLHKANRRDCQEEILSGDNPICRSLPED